MKNYDETTDQITLTLDDDSELVQKMKKKGRTENEKTENNKEN